ncbi:hypothetical protein BC827DRAFT_1242043, partial [Russula dissimulans]
MWREKDGFFSCSHCGSVERKGRARRVFKNDLTSPAVLSDRLIVPMSIPSPRFSHFSASQWRPPWVTIVAG